MASVPNEETQDFLHYFGADLGREVWLGGHVTDKGWEWEDGTSWTYQNWWATAALGTQGGTNQNCLQLRRIDLTWDDAKCSAEKWYVCEK